MKMRARRPLTVAAAASLLGGMTIGIPPSLADDDNHFRARLSGFEEVHLIPGPPAALRGAVSTKARGSFKARLDKRTKSIRYELKYDGLEAPVTQAHIHFGQHHTVGGIVVWLCQTTGTPAPAAVTASTPFCPQSGEVSGQIFPGQVLTVTGQGIEAAQFDELVAAMRAGVTYANVHSTMFPPGEIRGQISSHDD
jgi:hypothetical protein